MKRRTFLKGTLSGCVAMPAALGAGGCAKNKNLVPTKESATVALASGKDYQQLVQRVLKPLGGMERYIKKGDTVLIKPAIGFARTPVQGINTHPLVVKALVEGALDAGAKRVTVFDRPTSDANKCYSLSGIERAVQGIKDSRVVFAREESAKWVSVEIPKGQRVERWRFYKGALDADVYINVPVAKHHTFSGVTMGLKNVMGILGDSRFSIHYFFSQKIADLNQPIRPSFTLVDATRVLLDNGPEGGSVNDVKLFHTLVASTDRVAADAVAIKKFFGQDPTDNWIINAAYQSGLGQINSSKIKQINA